MWNTVVKSKSSKRIFDKLFDACQNVDYVSNSRHISAVVYKRKIVSIGSCQMKTDTFMLNFQTNEHKIFRHAEIDAIKRAINIHGEEFLESCDLYVMRIGRNGKIANSKPCVGCQKAIDHYKFKRVFWT